MCAIFQLNFEDIIEVKDIADEITRKYGNETAEQCFNIDLYPKGNAPVLGPQNKVALMRWGFPMKDSSKVIFNARSESLTEKSTFKNSLANRCLIPATSFYEFDKEKKKYSVRTTKPGLIYLAGLWKPYLYQGNKVYCFCIVTTTPNELIGQIHSRMPAIIPTENVADWLSGSMESLALLQPFNQPMMLQAI